MSEVVTRLTQDEITVLTIASHGEPMLEIGRWEKPIRHLLALGYMKPNGEAYRVITPEGRAALDDDEEDNTRHLASLIHQAKDAHGEIQIAIDKCAVTLAEAARRSRDMTGEEVFSAIRKWGEVIVRRALAILEGE